MKEYDTSKSTKLAKILLDAGFNCDKEDKVFWFKCLASNGIINIQFLGNNVTCLYFKWDKAKYNYSNPEVHHYLDPEEASVIIDKWLFEVMPANVIQNSKSTGSGNNIHPIC